MRRSTAREDPSHRREGGVPLQYPFPRFCFGAVLCIDRSKTFSKKEVYRRRKRPRKIRRQEIKKKARILGTLRVAEEKGGFRGERVDSLIRREE